MLFGNNILSINLLRKFGQSAYRQCTTHSVNQGTVLVENFRSIRLIGINRPTKKNSIDTETAEALLQAFKDFDADDDVQAAVLYGVGGTFCAGYDLSELSTSRPIIEEIAKTRGPMGPTRHLTHKPVVAAINGHAVAGGLEVALWCDFRYMEENAVMGVFCRRFGVPLIDGGTSRLPAIIGTGRAMDLILTGRPLKATEALQIGLIRNIVATGCVLGQSTFFAESLSVKIAKPLSVDRRSTIEGFTHTSISNALERETDQAHPFIPNLAEAGKVFSDGHGRHASRVTPLVDLDKAFQDFYEETFPDEK